MGPLREIIFKGEYKYYDTPDGEDCLKKLWYVTKYGSLYGVFIASADILLISHPKGYPQILARYGYVTLPLAGMAAAYSATSCMLTNLRSKDDQWNHFFGGVAVAAVASAWQKSMRLGAYGAFGFGLMGAVYKDFKMRGWPFGFPPYNPKFSNIWSIKRDYTILSDPGRK